MVKEILKGKNELKKKLKKYFENKNFGNLINMENIFQEDAIVWFTITFIFKQELSVINEKFKEGKNKVLEVENRQLKEFCKKIAKEKRTWTKTVSA